MKFTSLRLTGLLAIGWAVPFAHAEYHNFNTQSGSMASFRKCAGRIGPSPLTTPFTTRRSRARMAARVISTAACRRSQRQSAVQHHLELLAAERNLRARRGGHRLLERREHVCAPARRRGRVRQSRRGVALITTNRWYREVLRIWQPTDGTPHLAFAGRWLRDPATSNWYHLATMKIPFSATGINGLSGFQEDFSHGNLNPRRTDYRNVYYHRNGAGRQRGCSPRPCGNSAKTAPAV